MQQQQVPARVIKIFNAQLAALVDRLRASLPDNYNIRKGQMALQLAPSNMVFEFWVSTVMPACGAQLLARDLDYFMNMNFDAAMALLRGAALDGQIESAAKEYAGSSGGGDYATLFEETIRAPMLKLSDDGRAFCMDILANLSQLAANTMPPAPTVKPVAGYVMPPAPAADEEPEQEQEQEQEKKKKKKRSDEDDDGNNKRARTSSPPDDAAPAAAPAATLKRVEKDDLEEGAKKKRKPSPEQEEKEV